MLTSENIISGIQTRYRKSRFPGESTVRATINKLNGLMIFSYTNITEDTCEALIRSLNQDPEIQYAERDMVVKGCFRDADLL